MSRKIRGEWRSVTASNIDGYQEQHWRSPSVGLKQVVKHGPARWSLEMLQEEVTPEQEDLWNAMSGNLLVAKCQKLLNSKVPRQDDGTKCHRWNQARKSSL